MVEIWRAGQWVLVLRRLLSSSINAAFILLFLILGSICVAFFLFIGPFLPYLDTKLAALLFSITYSVLGAYSIGLLPRLGNIIARIGTLETRQSPSRKIKIVIRLSLFYLAPPFMFFVLSYPLRASVAINEKAFTLILFTMFCIIFSLSVIPISIIIGKGRQGLHDALAGLEVCKLHSQSSGDFLPIKTLASRTAIFSFILSFIIIIIIFVAMQGRAFAHFRAYVIGYAGEHDNKTKIEKLSDDFASIIPNSPLKCNKFEILDSIRWWVDLTCSDSESAPLLRDIGLPLMNSLDLQGYGFGITKLEKAVSLLDMDRQVRDMLPEGSKVLSVYLFLGDGIFYYPELKAIVEDYFLRMLRQHKIIHEFSIFRIKMVRMVKTGILEFGYFEEYYLYQGLMWRDEEHLYLPIIFNWERGNFNYPGENGSFITGRDLN